MESLQLRARVWRVNYLRAKCRNVRSWKSRKTRELECKSRTESFWICTRARIDKQTRNTNAKQRAKQNLTKLPKQGAKVALFAGLVFEIKFELSSEKETKKETKKTQKRHKKALMKVAFIDALFALISASS